MGQELGIIPTDTNKAAPLGLARIASKGGRTYIKDNTGKAEIIRGNNTYTNPNWLSIDKSKVGLSNVDNTADIDKPLSNAAINILNTKEKIFFGEQNYYPINEGYTMGFDNVNEHKIYKYIPANGMQAPTWQTLYDFNRYALNDSLTTVKTNLHNMQLELNNKQEKLGEYSGDFAVGVNYKVNPMPPSQPYNVITWQEPSTFLNNLNIQISDVASLSSTLSTYLPLSGGTLTGNLQLPSYTLGSSTTKEGLGTINQTSWTVPANMSGSRNFGVDIQKGGVLQIGIGAGIYQSYIQTYNSKPLSINPQGNDIYLADNSGNVGINMGGATISAKLHVKGSVRFEDGNQAANKVWVSDANGNGSWQYITSIGGGNPGTVTNVTASAPLSVTNSNTTPNISISYAGTNSAGVLSSTDWNTFNNKFTLPAFTAGSIPFSNGTTLVQNNSQLFWDNTNGRFGIGTTSPLFRVDLTLTNSNDGIRLNSIAGLNNLISFREAGVNEWTIGKKATSGDFVFNNGGVLSGSDFVTIKQSGRVGIGTNNPFSLLELGGASNKGIAINSALNNKAFLSAWQDGAYIGVNREPATGTFSDVTKMASYIVTNGTTTSSSIEFATASTVNTLPSIRVSINKDGNVGIGTQNPNSNAIIHAASTTKGSIPFPVMTQANRTAMSLTSGDVGLHVYQSDGTAGVYVWKGSSWVFAY